MTFGAYMEKKWKRAFTLVELSIVIAVIGIVSAIVVPILVTVYKKSGEVKELSYVETSIINYMGEFSHDRKMLSYIDGQYFQLSEDGKVGYYKWSDDKLEEVTDEKEIIALKANCNFEYQFGGDEKLKWSGGKTAKNNKGIDWYPGFYKVVLNYMDNGFAGSGRNTEEKLFVKKGEKLDLSEKTSELTGKNVESASADYISDDTAKQWTTIDDKAGKLVFFDYLTETPDKDMTLYAVWRNDGENFKLVDEYGNGIVGFNYDTFGDGLEKLPDDRLDEFVNKEEGKTYSFVEWEYYNETYGIKITAGDVAKFKGFANITVKAEPKIDAWKNRLYVDFVDANGKTTGTTEYRYGDALKLTEGAKKSFDVGTEDFKKYQYNFASWTYGGNEYFVGNEIILKGKDNERITLTANYEKSARKYKVNFIIPAELRYGKSTDKVISSNVYYSGEEDHFNHTITAPVSDADYNVYGDVLGYTVLSWKYSDLFLNEQSVLLDDAFSLDNESILSGEINFNVTVAPNEYVVEFKDGGVKMTNVGDVTFTVTDAAVLPEGYKEGCIFDGWKVGKEFILTNAVDKEFLADKFFNFRKIGDTKDGAGVYSLTMTAEFYKVAIGSKTSAIDQIDFSEIPTTAFESSDVNKFTAAYNPDRTVDFKFYLEDNGHYSINKALTVFLNGEKHANIEKDITQSCEIDGVKYNVYTYTIPSEELNVSDKNEYSVGATVLFVRNGKEYDVTINSGRLTLDIKKANPSCNELVDVTYYYKENLKKYNGFSDGYAWTNQDAVILTKSDAIYENCVTFTPADTDNYNVLTNIGVKVKIARGTVVLNSGDGNVFFDYLDNKSNGESVRTFNAADGGLNLSTTENDYEYVSPTQIKIHPIINDEYALPYVRTVKTYDASYNEQGKLDYSGEELVWFGSNDNVGQFHLSGASEWNGSDDNGKNKIFPMSKENPTVTFYGFKYYQTKTEEYVTTNGSQLAVYKNSSKRYKRMILPFDGNCTEVFTTKGGLIDGRSADFGLFSTSTSYDKTVNSVIIPKKYTKIHTHGTLNINAFSHSSALEKVIIEGRIELDKYTFTGKGLDAKKVSDVIQLGS